MKKRVILFISFIVLIAIISIIISYFFIIGAESKPTKELEQICNINKKEYNNRKVFTITPKKNVKEKNDTTIFYLHGGSYMAEMTKEHWNFIKDIAKDTGATIIVPDYPLTPKYDYNDVFNFILPLYKKVITNINTNNLIMMGDSAGGGMALALCEKLGEENIDMPSKLLLISPWLDISLKNERIDEVQKVDDVLNKDTLKLAGLVYAKDTEVDNYLVSPLYGQLNKLQNVSIYTGTYDILNPDVDILVDKAKDVNVEITVNEYKHKKHNWIITTNDRRIEQGYLDIIQEINNYFSN